MSKLSSSFVLVLLFSIVFANSNDFDNEISQQNFDFSIFQSEKKINIDRAIDINLKAIRKVLSIVDPAPMPNVPILSRGALTNGKLRHFSLVQRTGPCTVTYLNKILQISLNLGWDDIAYDYDYYFKLLFIERRGTLKGGIEEPRIHLSLGVDFENYLISLKEFRISNIGKLDFQLEGTFGDKLRSLIVRIIMNLAKGPIMSIFEKETVVVIENAVAGINKHIPQHNRQFTFVNYVTHVNYSE